MAAKRKQLSNKIRFEVFKRDKFTCQYCGRKAPDVVLNVDHIKSVADGGTNEILNLITSCFECNNGKRAIPLDKQVELDKQRESLEMMEERKQQIDMMYEWKKELSNIKDYESQKLKSYIEETYDVTISDKGFIRLKKWTKEFGFDGLMECVDISFSQYEDASYAFDMIPRICAIRKEQNKHPEYKDIYYLAKIGQANCAYYDKRRIVSALKSVYKPDDNDVLKKIFQKCRNWSELRESLAEFYGRDIL